MKKYNERILDIKRGQASVVSNTLTYNTRVAPVMSYVAQLMPLPKTFQERFGMLSILRCCNCMRHSDLSAIHELGGPKLTSLEVSCTAALTRTALKTITHWRDWIKQLRLLIMNSLHLTTSELLDSKCCHRPGFALTTGTPSLLY